MPDPHIPADSALSFLRLPSFEPLINIKGRPLCPMCKQKRKFFCYSCNIFMGNPADLPRVRLPVHVDVVHHPTELLSKSTAMHARLLASEDVTVYEYPDVPEFDPRTHVLAFPSDTAIPIGELDPQSFSAIVFVDSQWNRAGGIMRHEHLQALRCVKIQEYKTAFWRYQSKGPECLATIEAIYYFLRETVAARAGGVYDGSVDGLMYLYAFQYELIQKRYSKFGDVPFPRIEGYIREAAEPEDEPEAGEPARARAKRT